MKTLIKIIISIVAGFVAFMLYEGVIGVGEIKYAYAMVFLSIGFLGGGLFEKLFPEYIVEEETDDTVLDDDL